MPLFRWLLVTTVVPAVLGFALGVLPPKKTDPYQGLYLSARCATAFELDAALRMTPGGDLRLAEYLRRQRGFAVDAYNQAVDRLARKGVHAGRIVLGKHGIDLSRPGDRPGDQSWDCNRLLANVPPAPADALGAKP